MRAGRARCADMRLWQRPDANDRRRNYREASGNATRMCGDGRGHVLGLGRTCHPRQTQQYEAGRWLMLAPDQVAKVCVLGENDCSKRLRYRKYVRVFPPGSNVLSKDYTEVCPSVRRRSTMRWDTFSSASSFTRP